MGKFILAVGSSAKFSEASAAQSANLANEISAVSLSLEEATDVAEAVSKIVWHGNDGEAPLAAIISPGTGSVPCAAALGRRQMQDYTHSTQYFTAQQWDLMLSSAAASNLKMSTLVDHVIALGLRCPSEATVQKLATMFFICSEGVNETKTMASAHKLAVVKHLKGLTKAQAKSNPLEYILVLPADLQVFKVKHLKTYEAVFPSEPPVLCRLDVGLVLDICSAVPMRSTRKRSLGSGLGGSGVLQMANGMMQQMQQMQQLQMATVAALQGRLDPAAMMNLQIMGPASSSGLCRSGSDLFSTPAKGPRALLDAVSGDLQVKLCSPVAATAAPATVAEELPPAAAHSHPRRLADLEVPLAKGARLSVADASAGICKLLEQRKVAKAESAGDETKEKAKEKAKAKGKGKAKAKGKAEAKEKGEAKPAPYYALERTLSR